MRFHIPALIVLASAASVTAVLDEIQSGINNVQSGINNVQTVVNDAHTIASDVKNYFQNLPAITIVPTNVEGYFSSVENKLENVPQTAWNNIKSGLYPSEVVSWINGLPTNMRAEATSKLNQWANDLSTGASGASLPTPTKTSDSSKRAVALGAMGVAGVLAVAIVL